MPLTEPEDIEKLLRETRVIAMVGLSPKPERPSNIVARFMLAHGYDVIPVNPGFAEILGRPCYRDLAAIPRPVDMVDVFRKSEEVPPIAEAAVRIGAKSLWLQLGVINQQAAALAEAAGLRVVMDRCLKIEYGKHFAA